MNVCFCQLRSLAVVYSFARAKFATYYQMNVIWEQIRIQQQTTKIQMIDTNF